VGDAENRYAKNYDSHDGNKFFSCKSISDYSTALLCHRKLFHSVFMFWRQNILLDYTSLYLPIICNGIITKDINYHENISHKLPIQG